jgi:hypothetical protein
MTRFHRTPLGRTHSTRETARPFSDRGFAGTGPCGCVVQQFDDWRSSLHSRTIGAGILWQFHVMNQADANACIVTPAGRAEGVDGTRDRLAECTAIAAARVVA